MLLLILAVLTSPSVFADQLFENASNGSPLIQMVRSAQRSIEVEIYTMKDLAVIAELKAAQLRGVKLKIIQTPIPVGDICQVFEPSDSTTTPDCVALRSFVTFVKIHGGQYVPFSMSLCGIHGSLCVQHGKMVIFDHTQALLSTGNFDATSLCDASQSPGHCNRDFTIVTSDPKIVGALNTIFIKDLIGAPYDLLSIVQQAPRLTASPLSMRPLINFINSARRSIQLQNQYLNDPTINAALIAAARRGVKIYAMVSSAVAHGRLDPVQDASDIHRWISNFTMFDQVGIKSRIFDDHMKINGRPGYLHAKVMIVDGVHAWIGSVNGSTQSLTENREFGMFFDDPSLVKHLSSVISADFVDPNSESWQESLACKKDSCSPIHPGSSIEKGPSAEALEP